MILKAISFRVITKLINKWLKHFSNMTLNFIHITIEIAVDACA